MSGEAPSHRHQLRRHVIVVTCFTCLGTEGGCCHACFIAADHWYPQSSSSSSSPSDRIYCILPQSSTHSRTHIQINKYTNGIHTFILSQLCVNTMHTHACKHMNIEQRKHVHTTYYACDNAHKCTRLKCQISWQKTITALLPHFPDNELCLKATHISVYDDGINLALPHAEIYISPTRD